MSNSEKSELKEIKNLRNRAVLVQRYYLALIDLYHDLLTTEKVSMQRFFAHRKCKSNACIVVVNDGIVSKVGKHRSTKYVWLREFPTLEMADQFYESCANQKCDINYKTDPNSINVEFVEINSKEELWGETEKFVESLKSERLDENMDSSHEVLKEYPPKVNTVSKSKYAGYSTTKLLFGIITIKTNFYRS